MSATVVAAVLLIGTAACRSGGDAPTPPPTPTGVPNALVPGACIAAEGEPSVLDDTPITESAIVDCAEPHLYEVLAAQDIPGQFLEGTTATDADLTKLQAALDGARDAAVQVRFAAFARAYCATSLQRSIGLDSGTEVAGASIASLQLLPVSHRSAPYAALLSEGWAEQPAMVCANRFTATTPTPSEAPAEEVEGAQTGLLLSADLPVDQRLCFTFDATGQRADTSCDAVHDAELTVTFDATPLLDEEQLAAASGDPTAPFEPDVQELLDGACNDVLNLVVGEDHDEAIAGVAMRGAEGWGATGLINEVACYATPVDQSLRLPAGSVFGLGQAAIELAPRD